MGPLKKKDFTTNLIMIALQSFNTRLVYLTLVGTKFKDFSFVDGIVFGIDHDNLLNMEKCTCTMNITLFALIQLSISLLDFVVS